MMTDAAARATVFSKDPSKRDYDRILSTGTLGQFLASVNDGSRTLWNCLDLPTTLCEVPSFVR